jgi:hypothetical protein
MARWSSTELSLPTEIEQHWAARLRDGFAQQQDGLGFELIEVGHAAR